MTTGLLKIPLFYSYMLNVAVSGRAVQSFVHVPVKNSNSPRLTSESQRPTALNKHRDRFVSGCQVFVSRWENRLYWSFLVFFSCDTGLLLKVEHGSMQRLAIKLTAAPLNPPAEFYVPCY